ncbi:MAG: tRNA lysidine(34) synthetase TilS [Planctomycetota bacterium]|nr:tRNA lysidine(34) synthetase TilS [Planctomycetota bacterium]
MEDCPRQCEDQPLPKSKRKDVLPLEARRHPLVARIEKTLDTRCGVDGSKDEALPIVVGVSGGADSCALLLVLKAIALHERPGKPGLRPIVVHVNHHLRESADEDASFARQLASSLDVEFHLEHVHPGDLPGNMASNARSLRYQALGDVARRVGARLVAVAHHGDDQLETILMALGRGAGLEGLAGMPWRRDMGEGLSLLRPMLEVRHSECEAMCRSAGLEWREDPGNLDMKSARARIRQEVVPVLDALWPDVASRITNSCDLAQAAGEALDQLLARLFGDPGLRSWSREKLQGSSVPILGAGLRRAALDAVPEVTDELGQKHLIQAAQAILDEDRTPKTYDWPLGLQLIVNSKAVELKRRT